MMTRTTPLFEKKSIHIQIHIHTVPIGSSKAYEAANVLNTSRDVGIKAVQLQEQSYGQIKAESSGEGANRTCEEGDNASR